jgi:hypothetical protein
MSFKFIKTKNNKDAAVIDGYIFYFAKKSIKQNSTRFRCRASGRSCSCTIADDVASADRILR